MTLKKKKHYPNKMKLSFLERIYIIEVIRGLIVTGSVLTRNLFRFATFRKGAITSYYPEEIRPDYSPANRGRHVLTLRDNEKLQCISCNMCATICPAKAIEIESTFDPSDTKHPKSAFKFNVDYSRCIFCGFCVEACPEDAIRMEKEVNDLASYDRTKLWFNEEELKSWKKVSPPLKKY